MGRQGECRRRVGNVVKPVRECLATGGIYEVMPCKVRMGIS
ncbi:MAG: hypothetical protein BWY79_00266 [Actinobacteria bacterium ADurb.Bin444]|nr:MAG: hypothetical protein BWY79_00266 [Actinobacteria bacterium ADurb.Bin444]